MRRVVSIALVHHPVLSPAGEVTTTAVTNLDVHDLARSARTYGVAQYFVIHPIEAQRMLIDKIVDHWVNGSSGKRIPDRIEALRRVVVTPSLEDAFTAMGGRDAIEVWVTSAKEVRAPLPFSEARAALESAGKPVLLLFGTGWGLLDATIEAADVFLPPIGAVESDYNHLSVRSACAIALDRLLGDNATGSGRGSQPPSRLP